MADANENENQNGGFQLPVGLITTSLSLLNVSWDFTVNVLGFVGHVLRHLSRAFEPEVYVFFKDSFYPYRLADCRLNQPGTAEVEWYYDDDTKLFFKPGADRTHQKHFPYLSAEIKYNDLTLYDISDFVECMHWSGEDEAPSADHILSIWMMKRGIILSKMHLSLSVINEEGDTASIPMRSGV
jgi:hypothetical protein